MNDVLAMLKRQAAWQRARSKMTWTEKLRLAAELRKAVVALHCPERNRHDIKAAARAAGNPDTR
jgi:hypothetical protein